MTPTALGALPTNQPMPVGSLQAAFGNQEASAVWPVAGDLFLTGTGSMYISFVPTRRCFWVVQANILYISSAANWNRCDAQLLCIPADLDGRQLGLQSANSQSNQHQWESLALSAVFFLEANVGYTAYLQSAITDGVTQYHRARRHLNMFGYSIGEGVY